jgi:hypothetical protein
VRLDRIKALGPWVAEWKYLWIALAVNAIALVVALRPGTGEPVIRLTGLVLQLLGIATVIWGISETRAFFGHPSVGSMAKAWLQRYPLRGRTIVVSGISLSAGTALASGRAHATHGAGPTPTTDTRLDALEKNITSIHDRITATERDLEMKLTKAAVALDAEVRTRAAEDVSICKKLETVGTGGVHISAIGASWLFVGVILSTAALEIEKALR